MFKLGSFAVLCIGISIAVIIMSWGYFWNYQPDTEEALAVEQQAVALHKNALLKPQAEKRVQAATDKVRAIVNQWQEIVAKKTPPPSLAQGGINMAVDAWHMTIDVRVFRNSIQKALNKQLKAGGVKVINGPAIPEPGDDANTVVSDFFNYPAIPFPVVIFDLGQVTVQGTYQQIEANMKAWSDMPNYLAVADGLVLTGTSPVLTGTYNLSMVGYIRANVVYPSVQEAAATASTNLPSTAQPRGGRGRGAGGGAPPPAQGSGGAD